MTPMQSIQVALANYANLKGRARRSEYWWFFLFVNVSLVILNTVAAILTDVLIVLFVVFGLTLLLPSIAVTARRLHDTNRNGLWMIVGLVPVIGWITLLALVALPGTKGPNRFGPEPL